MSIFLHQSGSQVESISWFDRIELDRVEMEVDLADFEAVLAAVQFHGNVIIDLDDLLVDGRKELMAGLHHPADP